MASDGAYAPLRFSTSPTNVARSPADENSYTVLFKYDAQVMSADTLSGATYVICKQIYHAGTR